MASRGYDAHVTNPRPVLAAALTAAAVVIAAAATRRAGLLGPSASRAAWLRPGRAPGTPDVTEPGFTSRPVPRSVAALTTPEQADSPMVHDG